ncbi:hypothetical protein FNV43_RR14739 [Rhamnella rubrinervis]|uniref:Protein kinase domain-containing protein n=1 Tax=Rhamnella rubrinervis TaxID=2594499 RepID=A0A8K0H3I2_9ROSA|nr:hypothetical protein FNV43_RR14739 [Rhamnella rubrinervis]
MMIANFLITIIVLLMFSLWTPRAATIGKPGCQTLCGNVSIPFPFGIGATHCYIDKWFEIVCTNHTNNLGRPILKRINLEVVNISIDKGTVMVRDQITFSNCKDKDKHTPNHELNIRDNPFFFSATRNVLVAVSCGYLALLTLNSSTDRAVSYTSVGCSSTCSEPSSNDSYWGNTGIINNGCRGIDCCETTIPSRVKSFKIDFLKLEIIESKKECNYAFLKDQNSPAMKFEGADYVPVIMEWYLKHSVFDIFGKPLSNDSTTYCYFIKQIEPFDELPLLTTKCMCKNGFRGNPYVLDGCQDINECEEINENNCGSRICVNKIGRFECHERKSTLVLIGTIGAVLGAFVLLAVGAYGLYKAIKNRKDTRRKQKLFKRNGGLLLQKYLSSGEANVKKTRVFNSNELDKATDHFSINRIVGQGGHSKVYKGMLADGRIVAIKKSKIQDQEKVQEFINEVVILSQINHRNVVKLLGCCLETEVPLLVYEFKMMIPLTRLQIAAGLPSSYILELQDQLQLTSS